MKIAVPIWNDRVSPVFDTARQVLLVDYVNGEPIARAEEVIDDTTLPQRAAKLLKLEVDVLICGAISRPLQSILSGAGISVIPFVAGSVDEVLSAYIQDNLGDARLRMPGCPGRRRQCRSRSGARRFEQM